MTDSTGEGWDSSDRGRSVSAREDVHYEESISISDSDYAGLASLARTIALVSIVAVILFVPIALALFFGGVAMISGNSMVDLVTTVASGLPLPVLVFLAIFVLLVVGSLLLGVVMVLRGGSTISRNEVHTRVTDGGIQIDREGGMFGQSSGVMIPLESVTAVEYNDPEGDLKMNLGDVRAKTFIAGRGADWVRIDRSDGPAVYVGSDRPRMLAEVVGDLAPNVDGPRPFS